MDVQRERERTRMLPHVTILKTRGGRVDQKGVFKERGLCRMSPAVGRRALIQQAAQLVLHHVQVQPCCALVIPLS